MITLRLAKRKKGVPSHPYSSRERVPSVHDEELPHILRVLPQNLFEEIVEQFAQFKQKAPISARTVQSLARPRSATLVNAKEVMSAWTHCTPRDWDDEKERLSLCDYIARRAREEGLDSKRQQQVQRLADFIRYSPLEEYTERKLVKLRELGYFKDLKEVINRIPMDPRQSIPKAVHMEMKKISQLINDFNQLESVPLPVRKELLKTEEDEEAPFIGNELNTEPIKQLKQEPQTKTHTNEVNGLSEQHLAAIPIPTPITPSQRAAPPHSTPVVPSQPIPSSKPSTPQQPPIKPASKYESAPQSATQPTPQSISTPMQQQKAPIESKIDDEDLDLMKAGRKEISEALKLHGCAILNNSQRYLQRKDRAQFFIRFVQDTPDRVRTKLRKICFDGQFPFDSADLTFLGTFRITSAHNVLTQIIVQQAAKLKQVTESAETTSPTTPPVASGRVSDGFKESFMLFELPQEHLSKMLMNKGRLPISIVDDLKRFSIYAVPSDLAKAAQKTDTTAKPSKSKSKSQASDEDSSSEEEQITLANFRTRSQLMQVLRAMGLANLTSPQISLKTSSVMAQKYGPLATGFSLMFGSFQEATAAMQQIVTHPSFDSKRSLVVWDAALLKDEKEKEAQALKAAKKAITTSFKPSKYELDILAEGAKENAESRSSRAERQKMILQAFTKNYQESVQTNKMNLKEFLAATDYLKFNKQGHPNLPPRDAKTDQDATEASAPTGSAKAKSDISHLLHTRRDNGATAHPSFSHNQPLTLPPHLSPLRNAKGAPLTPAQQQRALNKQTAHAANENKMLFWDEQYRLVLEALKANHYAPGSTCLQLGISSRALSKTILLYASIAR